jgi:hypothetical protein
MNVSTSFSLILLLVLIVNSCTYGAADKAAAAEVEYSAQQLINKLYTECRLAKEQNRFTTGPLKGYLRSGDSRGYFQVDLPSDTDHKDIVEAVLKIDSKLAQNQAVEKAAEEKKAAL